MRLRPSTSKPASKVFASRDRHHLCLTAYLRQGPETRPPLSRPTCGYKWRKG